MASMSNRTEDVVWVLPLSSAPEPGTVKSAVATILEVLLLAEPQDRNDDEEKRVSRRKHECNSKSEQLEEDLRDCSRHDLFDPFF